MEGIEQEGGKDVIRNSECRGRDDVHWTACHWLVEYTSKIEILVTTQPSDLMRINLALYSFNYPYCKVRASFMHHALLHIL